MPICMVLLAGLRRTNFYGKEGEGITSFWASLNIFLSTAIAWSAQVVLRCVQQSLTLCAALMATLTAMIASFKLWVCQSCFFHMFNFLSLLLADRLLLHNALIFPFHIHINKYSFFSKFSFIEISPHFRLLLEVQTEVLNSCRVCPAIP